MDDAAREAAAATREDAKKKPSSGWAAAPAARAQPTSPTLSGDDAEYDDVGKARKSRYERMRAQREQQEGKHEKPASGTGFTRAQGVGGVPFRVAGPDENPEADALRTLSQDAVQRARHHDPTLVARATEGRFATTLHEIGAGAATEGVESAAAEAARARGARDPHHATGWMTNTPSAAAAAASTTAGQQQADMYTTTTAAELAAPPRRAYH